MADKGYEGNTLAYAVCSTTDLSVHDIELLKDVIHIFLGSDVGQVKNCNSVFRLGTGGVNVALSGLVGRGRRRRATIAHVRTRRRISITRTIRIETTTTRGRQLGEGLCTRNLEVATFQRLAVQLLNYFIDLVRIGKMHESRTLRPVAETSQNMHTVNWSHSFDVTSKGKLTSGEGKATNKDGLPQSNRLCFGLLSGRSLRLRSCFFSFLCWFVSWSTHSRWQSEYKKKKRENRKTRE